MAGQKFKFLQKVTALLERRRGLKSTIDYQGVFHIQQIRDGKVIKEFDVHNAITDEGLHYALDVAFNAYSPQVDPWYIGLINDSPSPAPLDADTMLSHAGWVEWTNYDETFRQDYNPDAAAAKAISNPTPATFTMAGGGDIWGIFITSDSAKSGTAGLLWTTANFTSVLTVVALDVLKITYTLTANG
jgi:hypothetical protein